MIIDLSSGQIHDFSSFKVKETRLVTIPGTEHVVARLSCAEHVVARGPLNHSICEKRAGLLANIFLGSTGGSWESLL